MWKQEQFGWLRAKLENSYSQWGEDGLISAIFDRIGTSNRYCIECGAADGTFFSNTRRLIEEGWSSLQIEADEALFAKLGALHHDNPNVTCYNYKVQTSGAFSFDRLLQKAGAPFDPDLMVIDVDGDDYWLANSLISHRPCVMMVEYAPGVEIDNQTFIAENGSGGQSGLNATIQLLIGKYYWPVAITQTNIIAVQQEVCSLLADDVIAPEIEEPKSEDAPKIAAVMSTPRVGPLATMDAVFAALAPFNIPLLRGEGAFWHHSLTRAIEKAIEAGAEYILTVDYDTVFEAMPTNNAVAKLVCLLIDHPDVDVIVSAQMKREGGPLLATTDREVRLLDPMIPITQGHFGLTLFRASVFERLPKPWLRDVPNEKGEWNENRVDADIAFWKLCEANGVNVQMSLDVMIGHMEWVVTWPGQGLQPVYQPLNDWREKGKPLEAFDRQRVIAAVKSNPALLYGAKMEMGG